jgi:hypothetical protein
MKRDFGIECWSSNHMRVVFLLVVPIFLIWVLGFPLITLYNMYKARKELDEPDNIIKYGLFYIGLKDETFFWEIIVNNLRKVLIVALSVTIQNGTLQLLMIFCYVYFNHQIIKLYKPY